jgi:hypothetical protein
MSISSYIELECGAVDLKNLERLNQSQILVHIYNKIASNPDALFKAASQFSGLLLASIQMAILL